MSPRDPARWHDGGLSLGHRVEAALVSVRGRAQPSRRTHHASTGMSAAVYLLNVQGVGLTVDVTSDDAVGVPVGTTVANGVNREHVGLLSEMAYRRRSLSVK